MIEGMSAATTTPAERRIAAYLAAAVALTVIFGFPPAPQAAGTRIATVIVIPPAKLPPAPSPETAAVEMPEAAALSGPSATRLQVVHDPQGRSGLALYGPLDGKAESAIGAVLTIFARPAPFDLAPVSQLLLADQSDRQAQALFTATVRGVPVIGVAAAALGEPGGDVAVLYDDADTFAASFPRLQQALSPNPIVAIGNSDNSVSEEDITAGADADANWDRIIAALTEGGDAQINAALARSLSDRLANDTGEPWRIVQPAAFR